MSLIVRPCEIEDREGLLHVWSLTYNGGKPFESDSKVFRHGEPFIALQDGKIVGGFGVMPMTATRGPSVLQSAGILAVAVLPNARQGGIGKDMMTQALRIYRERGYELAALYAFRDSYYRTFGYEIAGMRYKIQVDSARFPHFNVTLPAAEHGLEALEIIRPCYEAFAHRRSGLNLRPREQWERVLIPDSNRVVYTVGEPVEAYAVIQLQSEFWSDQRIEELVWTTRRGYESIMGILSGLALNKTKMEWFEPSDSPYRNAFFSLGGKVSAHEPQTMYRMVNVKKALEGLRPKAKGEFTIEVRDDILPENVGPWRVAFSPDGVEVARASQAGISVDVRQFVQAFLGEPHLDELMINDLVDVSSRSDYEAAKLLLTPSNTVCLDFF